MATSDYPHRFAWFPAPLGAPDAFGGKAREPGTVTFLWGMLEEESAGVETRLGSDAQVTRGTIVLRSHPDVRPRDLLRDKWDQTWRVETVLKRDDELAVEVVRP